MVELLGVAFALASSALGAVAETPKKFLDNLGCEY